ncbi:hypothetical protein [Leptolyngbya sp. ST-U4]
MRQKQPVIFCDPDDEFGLQQILERGSIILPGFQKLALRSICIFGK